MMALPFDGIALYLGIYGIADIHLDIVHFRFIFLENWYFWSWYSDLWRTLEFARELCGQTYIW